jgi:hypothetical protein
MAEITSDQKRKGGLHPAGFSSARLRNSLGELESDS